MVTGNSDTPLRVGIVGAGLGGLTLAQMLLLDDPSQKKLQVGYEVKTCPPNLPS
jgi:cation diffusion facilitator CzcD-associated flavoprotein CzcO